MSARPPRPPGRAIDAGPVAAAATSRPAASAAAASYASASVWYTSSCMAADRSETVLREPPPAVLTIAGSDPSGGAGIQADLKAFHAFGVYGAAVLTALTVQNTGGVRAIHPVPPDVVLAQLDAVDEDLRIAAAKIGLVPGPDHATPLASACALCPIWSSTPCSSPEAATRSAPTALPQRCTHSFPVRRWSRRTSPRQPRSPGARYAISPRWPTLPAPWSTPALPRPW